MATYCVSGIYANKVYNRSIYLSAGTQYVFETRDLNGSDTYMYLVRGNTIITRNDDYRGLASLIAYQPTVSGNYNLVIRSYSRYSRGTCDVYMSTGGGAPVKINNNSRFGGHPLYAHWKSDERIETASSSADPYLYLITGSTMYWNDDGGPGYHSRITPGWSGYGLVVVGSWSYATRGYTKACIYYQSYLDNPGPDSDLVDDPDLILSDNHFNFQQELMKYKAKLEAMPMKKRMEITEDAIEGEVKALRDKILSKEEIKSFEEPKVEIPKKLVKAEEEYKQILADAEKKLEGLDIPNRQKEMRKIEFQKSEIYRGLVPLDE